MQSQEIHQVNWYKAYQACRRESMSFHAEKMKVLAAQSCPILCDPTDCSPPYLPTLAHLSKGFSKQEYWSGLPFPFAEDLPNPGIKPRSPAMQTDSFTDSFLRRCREK